LRRKALSDKIKVEFMDNHGPIYGELSYESPEDFAYWFAIISPGST
jgi:hypothetical protein